MDADLVTVPSLGAIGVIGDAFGAAVAIGDFDGNGSGDLAIGTPGAHVGSDTGAGVVWIVPSSGGGPLFSASYVISQDTVSGGTAMSRHGMGSTLLVVDANRDGFDELLVGAPEESWTFPLLSVPSCGYAEMFFGSSGGLDASTDVEWDEQDDIPVNDSWLGAWFQAGDFDGDDVIDVLVGVPGGDVDGASAGFVLQLTDWAVDEAPTETALWSGPESGITQTPQDGWLFGGAWSVVAE